VLICHVSGADLVNRVIEFDLPTLFYVHSNDVKKIFDNVRAVGVRSFAAESRFIGKLVSEATGEQTTIIRPPLDPERYRVETRGEAVLVVNPHPKKGGHQVVAMARALPHRSFLVVGGWANTRMDCEVVKVEEALTALPNVERIAHLSDIRQAFRRSRCLLMPCLVEEAFGRTAAESVIAGIPVLASDRGALPETIGEGGIALSPQEPLTTWIATLEAMFTDQQLYQKLVDGTQVQARVESSQLAYVTRQMRYAVSELLSLGRARYAS